MRAAGWALALTGCLPMHGAGHRADAERFRIAVHAALAGPTGIAVVDLHGAADVQRTRRFRDGTSGRLVTLHVDGPLDGAWVELRAFDDGRVVDVDNLEPWAGARGHIELIDDLWAALSPLRRTSDAVHASWPGLLWTPWAWTMEGTWDDTGYRATLALPPRMGRGPGSDAEGSGHRVVRIDDAGAVVRSDRTLQRGRVTRTLEATASAEAVGPVAPVVLDMPYSEDDAAFDGLPLQLAAASGGVRTAFRGTFDAATARVFEPDDDTLTTTAAPGGPAPEIR